MNSNITKLVNVHEDKLLPVINDAFKSIKEKEFINIFYKYIQDDQYTLCIDFNDVWKSIGYSKKSNAKRRLTSDYINGEDYEIIKMNKDIIPKHGGHKETILITPVVFKNMCMEVPYKEGDEVLELYKKMDSIFEQNMHLVDHQGSKHRKYMNLYHSKDVVYVMCLEYYNNGSLNVKMGKSNNIQETFKSLSKIFGPQIYILDIFLGDTDEKFNQIVQNKEIKTHRIAQVNNMKSTDIYNFTSPHVYNAFRQIIKSILTFSSLHEAIDDI
jgi:hypothetical protein